MNEFFNLNWLKGLFSAAAWRLDSSDGQETEDDPYEQNLLFEVSDLMPDRGCVCFLGEKMVVIPFEIGDPFFILITCFSRQGGQPRKTTHSVSRVIYTVEKIIIDSQRVWLETTELLDAKRYSLADCFPTYDAAAAWIDRNSEWTNMSEWFSDTNPEEKR